MAARGSVRVDSALGPLIAGGGPLRAAGGALLDGVVALFVGGDLAGGDRVIDILTRSCGGGTTPDRVVGGDILTRGGGRDEDARGGGAALFRGGGGRGGAGVVATVSRGVVATEPRGGGPLRGSGRVVAREAVFKRGGGATRPLAGGSFPRAGGGAPRVKRAGGGPRWAIPCTRVRTQ